MLLGDGKGGLTSAQILPAGMEPSVVLTADLDRDGKLDVLVGGTEVGVFRGEGTGPLGAKGAFVPAGFLGKALALSDFDQDGFLDVLAGSGAFLKGDGTSTFRTVPTFDVPTTVRSALAADFNEDGRLDLALPGTSANRLRFLFTRGPEFAESDYQDIGLSYAGAAAADLNGDGHSDLAVITTASAAFQSKDSLLILLGNGRGGFSAVPAPPVGPRPSALAVADWDGDGKPDLAITRSSANELCILRGDGTGGFTTSTRIAVSKTPSALLAADFNHDKKFDLAVLHKGSSDLLILLGDGTGRFVQQGRFAAPSVSVLAQAFVLAGYVDADPHLDIILPTSSESVVLLGDGTGSFRRGPPLLLGTPLLTGAALGDLNGDRLADLVVTTSSEGSSVRILLGLGGGWFAPARRHVALPYPTEPALIDFNQDGLLDILVGSSQVTGVSFLDNRSL